MEGLTTPVAPVAGAPAPAPAQTAPAPAQSLPQMPAGITVTANANGGMTATVPTQDNSMGAAQVNPMETLSGAQIVPAGTEGAIVFKGADGQEISILPAAPAAPAETQAPATETVPMEQAQAQQAAAEDSIAKDLQSKGVDFTAVFNEYNESGTLGAATRETLNKAGYPNEVIDSIIAGREALDNRFVASVHEMVGGKEAWDKIAQYAMQDSQLAATINAVVNTGDLGQIRLVTEGIVARMNSQYGTANPSIMGSGAMGQKGVTPYATSQEMVKAMSDPKYQTDSAYTQEVYARVAASNLF